MLVFFSVGNYKSIKDPVTISFGAASISEHTDSHIVKNGRESLLKSVLVYGHNASGKSNLLDALLNFRYLITRSALEKLHSEPVMVEPFLLNTKTADGPSFFEAIFILDGIKYRYGFEADKECIRKEWLLETKAIKEQPLFLRLEQDFEIDEKRFENADGLQKRTRKNVLFISVASQWNVKKAEKISLWFDNIVTIHGLMDNMYEDFTLNLLEDEKYKQTIIDYMRKADLGIADLEVLNFSLDDIIAHPKAKEDAKSFIQKKYEGRKPRTVFALHKVFDENGEVVNHLPFILEAQESEGTKKYFNLIGAIVMALENNYFVVIDEFDARFHSLLSKAIVQLFNNNKRVPASQLLVASHDTALLDKDLLRRDQIYFVEKNQFEATGVTSLVEYKVRKEAPYDKNYLNGKFGAIPMIDNLEPRQPDDQKETGNI